MKKLFVLSILMILTLQAVEVKWMYSYADGVSKAKKENKNIMLLVTSEKCGWCRKLENVTLTDAAVVDKLNRDYIVIHANRDTDDYPEHLKVSSVPATFFLGLDEKPIIRKVVGYWSAEDFLSYLDDVDYKLGKKEY